MSKALIICDSPKGVEYFADVLSQNGYDEITAVDNGEEGKRKLIEGDYELCLINAPIRGSSGEQLSIDIAEKNVCQVLLFVKAEYMDEITEKVENYGVITVSRPISKQMFWSALKLAKVAQRRISLAQQENAKLQKKLESLKLVSKAKLLLISYEGYNEEQAHKYIEQYAMNERMTRTEVATMVIERYS